MNYKRYNLVGVVENVFKDRDIIWPDNEIMEKVNSVDLFKKEEKVNEPM